MSKPRYPAKWFHLLKRYPRKFCTVCGRQLTPQIRGNERSRWLESVNSFIARKTCGGAACRAAAIGRANSKAKSLATREECLAALRIACSEHPDLLEFLGTDNPHSSRQAVLA